jgi:cell division protein FtsZ
LETTINGASHVIINISGDISLMDANDAASYVQDLAGDEANIIFGAKYDETMSDEATITVIATGLENQAKQSAPTAAMGGRFVYPGSAGNAGATNRPVGTTTINRPVTPPSPTPSTPFPNPTPSAANYSGIQKPKQPESTVKPVEINIPDFLKNTRR